VKIMTLIFHLILNLLPLCFLVSPLHFLYPHHILVMLLLSPCILPLIFVSPLEGSLVRVEPPPSLTACWFDDWASKELINITSSDPYLVMTIIAHTNDITSLVFPPSSQHLMINQLSSGRLTTNQKTKFQPNQSLCPSLLLQSDLSLWEKIGKRFRVCW